MMTDEEFLKEIKNSSFSGKRISDIVYDYLYNKIITFEYSPGIQLNTSKIAQHLNVSRTPVQHAIDKLCEVGLVQKISRKKTIVSPFDLNNFKQLIEIRIAIEGQAAYLAAASITDHELQRLEEYLKKAKKNAEKGQFSITDEENIHSLIVSASHNIYLIKAYENYKYSLARYRYYLVKYELLSIEDLRRILNRNIGIYNALKNRLSSTAKAEMLNDIQYMREWVSFKDL